MNKKLKFERLKIYRFPGFHPGDGFSLEDLASEVNVIYGPNGSGKTTVAKALQNLIWSKESPDRCHLNGEFVLGSDEWYVENEAGNSKYVKNGDVVDPLSGIFPPSSHKSRYYLALHELLQKTTRNRDFAEIVNRESAGGYDISSIEEDLGFRSRPSNAGRSTDRKAENKFDEVKDLERRLSGLQGEKQSLNELKQKLHQAKEAKRRANFYEDLIDYRKQQGALNEVNDRLDSFPEPVKKITGDEKQRLHELIEDIDQASREKEESLEDIDQARTALEKVDLPEGGVPSGLLTELEGKVDRLQSLERDLEETKQKIIKYQKIKERVTSRLADEYRVTELNDLSISSLNDFSEFAREAEEVRSKLEALRSLFGWLGEKEEKKNGIENLRQGRKYLENWLSAGSFKSNPVRVRWLSITFGVLNAVVAFSLSLTIHPFFLFFLVSVVGSSWIVRQSTRASEAKRKNKKRYLELELKEPAEWSRSSVRSLLVEMVREEAEVVFERKKEEYLAAKRDELDLIEKKRAELEKKKEKLVEQCGVAPDIDEGKFYWLVERLNRWEKAEESLKGLLGKKERLEKLISGLREELRDKLKKYGYERRFKGLESIRGCLRDLNQRKGRFTQAKSRLREAKRRKREAERRLKRLREKKRKLYENLGLEEGDRTSLINCYEQRDNYQELLSKSSKLEAVCNSKLKGLKSRDEFHEKLLDRNIEEIKEEYRELSKKAEKRDRLFKEISQIEERIHSRKSQKELEMTRAELDRALEDLENQLYSDYNSITGNILLDYLKDEGLNRTRPRVLERGGEIFTRVTKGEYRLLLGDASPPSFKAVDTESGEVLSLEELSSGTRLQLLMSVRMGFVESQEEGVKMPLFLDELLANSDDLKASEIIDVALEFCREGRQIFYFTAQGDEVARWRDKLEMDPEVSGNFFDLSEARDLNETISIPNSSSSSLSNKPPEPEDMNHEEYGKQLSISKFNPFREAGSAHLWYLIEAVETLYRLLRLGVETWGQFKALNEEGSIILDRFEDHEISKIRELGLALEEYVKARKVGRNRPIDRSVLVKSGAVTENFMEEVTELAKKIDGEPEELIDRLEQGAVTGFRSRKKEELEDFLVENGYLSKKSKLSQKEIKTRLLASIENSIMDEPSKVLNRLVKRLHRQ